MHDVREGALFRYILDYLRCGQLVLPESFRERSRLRQEAEFYRLSGMLKYISGPTLMPNGSGLTTTAGGADGTEPGFILVGYRGTFQFGRDGLADVKFRKISRILVSGRVSVCREVFGDTLNESRDPDRGTTAIQTAARPRPRPRHDGPLLGPLLPQTLVHRAGFRRPARRRLPDGRRMWLGNKQQRWSEARYGLGGTSLESLQRVRVLSPVILALSCSHHRLPASTLNCLNCQTSLPPWLCVQRQVHCFTLMPEHSCPNLSRPTNCKKQRFKSKRLFENNSNSDALRQQQDCIVCKPTMWVQVQITSISTSTTLYKQVHVQPTSISTSTTVQTTVQYKLKFRGIVSSKSGGTVKSMSSLFMRNGAECTHDWYLLSDRTTTNASIPVEIHNVYAWALCTDDYTVPLQCLGRDSVTLISTLLLHVHWFVL